MAYELKNQSEVRAAFWQENPEASHKKITAYSGKGKMYTTDTRVAFVDWLDGATRDGRVSPKLAQVVTLGGGE